MNTDSAALLWFAAGFVLANLPFVTERWFGLVPMRAASDGALQAKGHGVRLVELLVGYGLMLVIGFAMEEGLGARQAQTWNFYAISGLLFLVMAFPGFVWRVLRRSRPQA